MHTLGTGAYRTRYGQVILAHDANALFLKLKPLTGIAIIGVRRARYSHV